MKQAGALLFSSSALIILGILTAEIFFPGYSISQNMISNLGARFSPLQIYHEPSAEIFNWSMKIAGVLILVASYFFYKTKHTPFSFVVAALGISALGVGFFPANTGEIHSISALCVFASSGVAAVCSYFLTKRPFRYFSFILGILTISFLFMGLFLPHIIVPVFGAGGTERWVAYPSLLWMIGFGGYLMNSK